MSLRLRYSDAAGEDLIGIWTFLAARSPRAADRVLDRLDAKIKLLLEYPEMGVAGSTVRPGLRMTTSGDYIIFYKRNDDEVEIIRVAHGRRDLATLFP